MKKRLILVAHGIGEQAPGDCVGLLTSSMPPGIEAETSYDIERLEEENGGPLNYDGTLEDPPEIPTLFDCHTRRMRTASTDHIFAEVYWSDVVVTGRGAFDILISLVRVILGLGHIVRESAAVAYDNDRVMCWLCNAAIYLIHGPIAAMNTVLLIGAIVGAVGRSYSGEEGLTEDLRWMLMVGLPVAGYAFYKLRMSFYRNISYLWRSYWRWLFASALAVTALALSIHYTAKSIPQVTSFEKIIYDREVALRAEYCETGGHAARLQCSVGPFFDTLERSAVNMICRGENLLQGGNRDCKADLRGLYLIGVFVLLAQQLVWMICFVLMTVILFLHMILWFRWRSDPVLYHRVPSLASVALSSMALFWILLLCCIWAVGFLLDENFAGNFQLFKAAFVLVWINWLFAIALAVGAGLILLIPFARWKRAVTPETYFHDGETPRPAPRLIVSTSLAILTMLCPVFLLVLSIVSLLRDEAIYFHDWNQMNVIAGFAYDHFRRILFMSAAVGVALYAFREQLRIGIGLGSDVINYFRVLDYHPDPKQRIFFIRERIERRFISVARAMIARHRPDEVVIVAHSQGTVVALDVLRKGLVADLIRPDVPWKLVTMGSPYTHIYGKYFPEQFIVPGRRTTGLTDWVNIFRIDDFVGTHISERRDGWPEEVPVGCRGHTNYWVDIEVVPHLRRHLYS